MPMNKALPTSAPESIELAWANNDEIAATRAVVRKYARVLDMTDSGRDIKPLASGMFEAIDRLKSLEAASEANRLTPYAQIMREAEKVLADAS